MRGLHGGMECQAGTGGRVKSNKKSVVAKRQANNQTKKPRPGFTNKVADSNPMAKDCGRYP